jgi:hypothetical protein
MRKYPAKVYFGIGTIVLGLILLLDNLGLINFDENFWWGLAFIILGFVLLRVYRLEKSRKGPLWVGLGFLVGGLLFWSETFAGIPGAWIGIIILWFLAAAFGSIFIQNSSRWWAALVAGILFISGVLNFLDSYDLIPNYFFSFIFFFGVSLTFWFLYLIRDEKNKLSWAGIVAMLLMIFSFFLLQLEWNNRTADILLPISIIIGGIFLIYHAVKTK